MELPVFWLGWNSEPLLGLSKLLGVPWVPSSSLAPELRPAPLFCSINEPAPLMPV